MTSIYFFSYFCQTKPETYEKTIDTFILFQHHAPTAKGTACALHQGNSD